MMRRNVEGARAFWDSDFPGLIPRHPTGLPAGPGRRVRAGGPPDRGRRGRSHRHRRHDRAARPSIGLVVAGDVVYNGVHQMLLETPGGGFESWLAALDIVESLNPRAVVAGHKNRDLPDDPAIIEQTRQYLRDAQKTARREADSAGVLRRDHRPLPGPAQHRPGLVRRARPARRPAAVTAVGLQVSAAFATTLDTPEHIQIAEELGFTARVAVRHTAAEPRRVDDAGAGRRTHAAPSGSAPEFSSRRCATRWSTPAGPRLSSALPPDGSRWRSAPVTPAGGRWASGRSRGRT